ncbi:MAG: 16S rRNA (adenine(1518)-N(6)/adenine(1519)-N(6))-dimethyltransferase RsmA [Ekhidna sp.]|nr:16S rRNA (adenine(1518)-N(6)/adenine(1519)-N(6))-dimethyltransferase RsmA [Ekhidna sp.]
MVMVKPKKYLGQHFLKDENIASKIADSLLNKDDDLVIEIGPGTGVLTKYLLSQHTNFLAFDIDKESIDFLVSNYPDHAAKFVFQDYLHYTLEKNISMIGNFPYNISSQLFFKIWDDRSQVKEVVCMVQKEVADRICADHGNKTYGILSVLLQTFYDIEYLFKVPPGVFNPPPKVQSAVIRLVRNDVTQLGCDEQLFKRIVKAGFGKRRKTLRNTLKDLNLSGLESEESLLSKRAEQLSADDFVKLTTLASN